MSTCRRVGTALPLSSARLDRLSTALLCQIVYIYAGKSQEDETYSTRFPGWALDGSLESPIVPSTDAANTGPRDRTRSSAARLASRERPFETRDRRAGFGGSIGSSKYQKRKHWPKLYYGTFELSGQVWKWLHALTFTKACFSCTNTTSANPTRARTSTATGCSSSATSSGPRAWRRSSSGTRARGSRTR